MSKRILLLLMSVVTCVAAWAVPAKQGTVITHTQKDGTVLTLQLTGDEYLHYYVNTVTGERMQAGADGDYYVIDNATFEARQRRGEARRAEVNSQRMQRLPMMRAQTSDGPMKVGSVTTMTGTKKGLVILVNYTDVTFKAANDQTAFYNQFNQEGYNKNNHIGSVKDYFSAQSYDNFTIDFDVVGPVTVSKNMAYYGGNSDGDDMHPAEMVIEAINLADTQCGVDYSKYDWDGDGYVDQVFVIYAGYNEAQGGSDDTIWPHEWTLAAAKTSNKDGGGRQRIDGKYIDTYACTSELAGSSGSTMDGIGTACHEFSHCLGYPDLYDADYAKTNGQGWGMSYFDVMASGSYSGPNGRGEVPCGYSAYERWMAGWLTPVELTNPLTITNMPALNDEPVAYIIYNNAHKDEYLLLENRQNNNWFKYLNTRSTGKGLLITHVDYNSTAWSGNTVNNDGSHQRFSYIPADNSFTSSSLVTDYFPTTTVTGMTSTSHTSCGGQWFNGSATFSNMDVTNIRQSDGLVSFLFNGGSVETPTVYINGVAVTESEVTHEGPLTITLSQPTGCRVMYLYLTDDEEEMKEAEYTDPITISESMLFSCWSERGDFKSLENEIHFIITEGNGNGEEPGEPEIQTVPESALDANGVATIDFSHEAWGFPTTNTNTTATYFDSPYGIICNPGTVGNGWKKQGSGLLIGQTDASIILPPFAFDVEKIVCEAVSNSSGKVTYNIYVGDQAVSDVATGTTSTQTFNIASDYQTAGTRYVLKVTNKNNAQFQIIKVYKKGESTPVVETVATPAFTPAAGEVEAGTTVAIACATDGATIHYTIDGTAPTANSTTYTAPIAVNEAMTIKAIAVKSGWNDSEVAEAAYTINQTTVDPQDPQTEGSFRIVYKGNGNSSQDASTAFTNDSKYQVAVEEGGDIATMQSCSYVYQGKANMGIKFGSSSKNGTLTLNMTSDYQKKIEKVVVNAYGYDDAAKLKVNNGTAQDIAKDESKDYTFDLDGTALTSLTLDATKRLYVKSITFYEVEGNEPEKETVATPTFNPATGEVEAGTEVVISCATEGATIHYTVNGDTPTANSTTYTAPIAINEAMTIKAIAVKDDWNDSEVATASYTIKSVTVPEEERFSVYTFDFTADSAYGMTLLSGNTQDYNADPYTCEAENVNMVLNGKTRWWDASGTHSLRFYKDSSFTLDAADGYKILSAELKDATAKEWDKTSFSGFDDEVTFAANLSKGNTQISGVDVQLVAVPTFSISNIGVLSNENGVKLQCSITHNNSQHVKKYKVWVVRYADGASESARRAEGVELGSIEIPAADITDDAIAVSVPLSLESNSGVHNVAIRAHAELAGDNHVYHSAWQEGDTEGSTGNENYSLDTVLTGIDIIGVDSSAVYYDLQGNRVKNPAHGQIVIRIANGKAQMIVVR